MIETLTKALLPGEVPLHEVEIRFADNLDDVLEFKEWLSRPRDVLALDTETAGLDAYAPEARIRLMQFGDQNTCWVINCEKWAGVAQWALENYKDAPHVWHNASFDYTYIRSVWPTVKFPWDNTHDTMIYMRLHDNQALAGLKKIGGRLFGKVATIGQELLDKAFTEGGWNWNTVPMSVPAYSMYSGMDVILTARLYKRLEHIHSGRYAASARTEMQAMRICTDMSIRGMLVDRDYCVEQQKTFDDYSAGLRTYLEYHIGGNPNSGIQLARYFAEQGAVLTKFSPKTGAPSFDKEAMEGLAAQGFVLADHILEMRKAEKLSGTYFENLLKFSNNPQSLIHPQINTMEATTGRMSVTQPALQTLPSGNSVIRNAFVAGDGNRIVTCDFSQIEMRLTAHLSSDAALIDAFKDCDATGADFFTRIGVDLYGAGFQKSDPRRKLIKNVMYGSTYGAGVQKMSESARVPVSVMEPIAEDIFRRFVGVKGIQAMASREAENNQRADGRPYIHTATGRRLFVDPDRLYSSANYAVQGLAADAMKGALISLDKNGLGDLLRLPVHDEVICVVPEGDVDDAKYAIREAMTITEAMGYAVQIPAEPEGPYTKWTAK